MTATLAIAYASGAVVMFALDMIWLSTMNPFYRREIGHLLAEKPNWPVAIGFYLIYLVGLTIFVIQPNLAGGNWQNAAAYGALFGFFAYATYDLTNLATAKNFTWRLALTDMAWGTTLGAVTSAAGVLGATYFA